MLYKTSTDTNARLRAMGGRIFGAQGLKRFEQSFGHPSGTDSRSFWLEIGNFNTRSLSPLPRTLPCAQRFAAGINIKCTMNFCSRHFRATLRHLSGGLDASDED
jgi:hypothetical protein